MFLCVFISSTSHDLGGAASLLPTQLVSSFKDLTKFKVIKIFLVLYFSLLCLFLCAFFCVFMFFIFVLLKIFVSCSSKAKVFFNCHRSKKSKTRPRAEPTSCIKFVIEIYLHMKIPRKSMFLSSKICVEVRKRRQTAGIEGRRLNRAGTRSTCF